MPRHVVALSGPLFIQDRRLTRRHGWSLLMGWEIKHGRLRDNSFYQTSGIMPHERDAAERWRCAVRSSRWDMRSKFYQRWRASVLNSE